MQARLSCLVLLAACQPEPSPEPSPDRQAEAMARAVDAQAQAAALLQAVVGGIAYGGDPQEAAADRLCEVMADQVSARFTIPNHLRFGNPEVCSEHNVEPACEPATSCEGSTMTVSFDGCTGPYGLVDLGGTITASLAVQPQEGAVVMTATVSSEGLAAGGVAMDIEAVVVSTLEQLPSDEEEAGRTPLVPTSMEVTETLSVGSEDPIVQEGTMSMVTDPATHCIAVSASGQVSWEGLQYDYAVDEERCGGACALGGESSWTAEGETMRLLSDGSASPSWEAGSAHGKAATSCRPQGELSPSRAAADLYNTAWSCTGVQACLEFYAPAPGSGDDIDALIFFPDDPASCGAAVHAEGVGEGQVVQVDECSFSSGMGVTFMEQTWVGSVPDYYDMLGGYRLYEGAQYWGSLPSYCEPFSGPGPN
jgi:hypothetical protein